VQLSNGRLIFPAAYHPNAGNDLSGLDLNGRCTCFYSDDSGATWKPGETILTAPESAVSRHPDYAGKVVTDGVFQEPGLVELSDGRLMMWMRTNLGCQYKSYSSDGGITWTAAEPSDLICPLGPASIKRIPSTGDLLVLYNDHSGRFPYDKVRRVPLVSAISKDDGATWQNHRLVESDLSGWYCYTLISFVDDYAILGYCVRMLTSMRLTRIPISWFYGE
jgi:Neuraminidase (sialidase)